MGAVKVEDKKYVEFLFNGFFFAEKDHVPYKKGMRFPKGAYAYRTFNRREVKLKEETLYGDPRYDKFTYYKIGSVVTKANDVPIVFPGEENKILRSNVEINNYWGVVQTPFKNILPFNPKEDKVCEGKTVQ